MNEFTKKEGVNKRLDAVGEGIEQTYADVGALKLRLEQVTGAKERKAITELLIETGKRRSDLIKERDELFAQMDGILERIGAQQNEEQFLDFAGALLRGEKEIQESVIAQARAQMALDEAREIAFGEPVNEEEIEAISAIITTEVPEIARLPKEDLARWVRRAARFARTIATDEVPKRIRDELKREKTGVDAPRAWGDIPWRSTY